MKLCKSQVVKYYDVFWHCRTKHVFKTRLNTVAETPFKIELLRVVVQGSVWTPVNKPSNNTFKDLFPSQKLGLVS